MQMKSSQFLFEHQYDITSIINDIILMIYVVCFCLQMIVTVVVLYAAKRSKIVKFQDFDTSIVFKVSFF